MTTVGADPCRVNRVASPARQGFRVVAARLARCRAAPSILGKERVGSDPISPATGRGTHGHRARFGLAHAPSAHAPSAHAPSIRGRPPGRTGSGLPPARRPGHTAGISRMAQVGRRPGTAWHRSVDRGIRTQPCRDTQAATVAVTSAHMARRRDVRTTDVRTTAARRPSTSVDPTVPAIVRRGPPHQVAVPVSARRIGAVHRPIARPGDLRKARSSPRGPAGGRAPGRNHRPGRDQTR